MIKEAISAIVDDGRDLTEGEAAEVMHEIMRAGREHMDEDEARATEAQFGAFVTALRMKGETVEEITGMARIMRAYALRVEVPDRPLLDTCGTGGSRKKKFNASTAAAFVAAAAGREGREARQPRRPAHSPAPPICSRRWARTSRSARSRSPSASSGRASASCSRRSCTRR